MAISTAAAVPSLKRDGEDTSDHELVARVRAGDDRAFEQLYRRYQRRIGAYVQGMVHDHARAEDVTQDVFVSALRRMRDTDRPIAFKPWIYEIAKNACIDQFRRSKRAEEVSYDAEDALGSADYVKLVTKDPGPDVAVENKQSLDHLRGAFGGLSQTHHEILVMRELEGLSYREIGERLGMTRPAVESTLFRARRRLTEEYEQLVTGERCQRVQAIISMAAAGGLGARDRRRLARHCSYCQPCLRHARVAGIDAADLRHTPAREKIAALLPLPAFLKRKLGLDGGDGSTFATWSAQASVVDPALVSGWGKAATAAATIAFAGVGAGVATTPRDAARTAMDAGTLVERISASAQGDRALRQAAAPLAAPAAAAGGTGGGAERGPGAGAGAGGSATGGSAPGSGGSISGSGSGAAAAGGGSAAASPAGALTTPPAPSLPSGESARSTPLGDALDRLAGGSGNGGSGGGSQSGGNGPPPASLPATVLPGPSAGPAPAVPPDPAAAVGGVAGEAVTKVDAAGDAATGAVEGVAGGK